MKRNTLTVLLAPSLATAAPCGKSGTSGCNLPSPFDPGSFGTSAINVSNVTREYGVWVPKNYNRGVQTGLIFSYHGANGDISSQRALDGLTEPDFNTEHIVVYLQGVSATVMSHSGITVDRIYR